MTVQIKKEFRVLLAPWIVAIGASFSLPVVNALSGRMRSPFHDVLPLQWLGTLVGVCIFVACLVMAAMSFGVEIHHRTFGLLLAQPVERSRIWWSKMLPLAGAYISVGVAIVAGQYLAVAAWGTSFQSWNGSGLFAPVVLLAGVMCSSAFWTLQSRSVIGGMVLPLAMQALMAGVIAWFASGSAMNITEDLASGLFQALGIGALVYCVLFTYLGWRKFSRLEWREGSAEASVIGPLPAFRAKESGRAAPVGPWASLLRKELRLHRPVFYLAALFIAIWLGALGLKALIPGLESRFERVFIWNLVIYLPLVWLLSGCISLGEEKRLGTWGWHLTLSVSRARQWAIKISFALIVVLILGILVPSLAMLAARVHSIGIPEVWLWGASPALFALLAAVYGTVLSFWAVVMFGTAIRAVLFAMAGACVLLFGGAMMSRIGREVQLLQGLSKWLIVEFQLPPYDSFSNPILAAGTLIGLCLLLVLLLRQSYVHCRREPSPRVVVRCSLILLVALFLPLWLSSDISFSSSLWSYEVSSLSQDLGLAVSRLPASIKEDAIEKSRQVSLEELDRTGMLHAETRRWLRGASVRTIPVVGAYPSRGRPIVRVGVSFPNGRYFETVALL